MIRLENVSKQYGNFFAVKNLNFEIKKGEIVGFLGKNGAGKTTTMNIITGFIESSEGKIFIDGIDVDKKPSKAKAKIGYMPEKAPLYADLTVEEFIRYMAELKGISRKEINEAVEKVIEEVGLKEVRNRLTRNISRGYKQRASLAGALVGKPEILILDEPTVGLDPKQVVEVRNLIKNLGKEYTILLSSHILSEVNQICEKVIIINNGQIVAIDTPENLENTVKNNIQTVYVTVIENEKTVIDLKEAIEGITRIKLIEKEENDEKEYLIEYNGNEDIRKLLFEKCSENNITILELSKENVSLEDAFIDIIDKDKKTAKERIINKREEKKVQDKKMYEEIKKEIEAEDKARKEKKKKKMEAKKKGGKK